ncbi:MULTISPECIES: hypothetical protein [Streptomyces]|uniref:Uncharacterized protein n=2 Tax=Streptomyces TaxID=1883 RepID=A0A1D8G5M7_9ACTN|nr:MULTISPECIES: hypothetical protein [Streptomyces]AOT60751.1 hypothetical protein A4G23_03626 [Streptomyces rubrolavendulae]KAF0649490.1 hypothetical protein K701_12955 [Streptomyces fradiae ATCC 10745 = DSM 40063]OSY49394.1 hypothetical protein BG846_04997 [Streptomyces fradiae ATCC 10745 = DSM 40063]QEV13834.1 hypothetical protein CP974_19640 [Streptomyces fradiae ATCC 10745 = DSM 40063]UQS30924.1 hypothetical protein J5J01_04155 [Streptomyces fradiae]
MAAESGDKSERDPLEVFVDEIFEEIVRDAGIPPAGNGAKHRKDPLAGALMEAAVAFLSQPPSRSTELERVLLAQTLATALAESLAPTLADVLASEIMKVLNQHAASQSGGGHETVGGSGRGPRSSGRGER